MTSTTENLSRPTTMQDIADRCGVTRATVSLALRSDPRISEKTADKVRRIADELGYDPMAHQAARRMGLRRHGREQLTRQVALLAPRCMLHATYYRRITDAIWLTLADRGYSLQLVDADGVLARDRGDGYSSLLKPDEIDGLICISHLDTLARAAELRKRAGLSVLPAVSLTASLPGFASVYCDDHQAGADLAKALFDLGHRTFFCVDPTANASGRDRWSGFAQGLKDLGLMPEKAITFHPCDTSWMKPEAARERLGADRNNTGESRMVDAWKKSSATVITGCNDAVALHARGALLREGIRTPEDVSLTGYDDTDIDADPFNLLSSVDVRLEQMGEQGVALLLDMIGKDRAEPREIVLKAQVNLRASVAPPAG